MERDTLLSPLSGFRDFLPTEQATRRWVIDTALATYSSYGYAQVETPALERNEVLNGVYGEEGDALRYTFEDRGGRSVGLRYDLTVPFARMVGRFVPSGDIQLPFRRSQAAPVWRADSPQVGRYREFVQCDFDLCGSTHPVADAEVLVVAANVLSQFGVTARVRVNHRGILDALMEYLEVLPEHVDTMFIGLDKFDKVGSEGVRAYLTEKGIPAEKAEGLLAIVTGERSLEELQLNEVGQAALANLQEIVHLAAASGAKVEIDPTIVRGLSYYTGLVFECVVEGQERFGTVFAGGRYDGMIGHFLGREVPTVGGSLGIDRFIAVLNELNKIPTDQNVVDVAVVAFPEQLADGFSLANQLRVAGLSVTLYPGADKMGAMMGFAARSARYAVVVGSNEVTSHIYQLKNLETREQCNASVEEIVQRVQENWR